MKIKQAWKEVDELTEAFQYYLLKASNELAKEKVKCEYFNRTKYSDSILPIDTYKKEVDEIVNRKLSMKWEQLRKDIKENGLRHSTYRPNYQNLLVWFLMRQMA